MTIDCLDKGSEFIAPSGLKQESVQSIIQVIKASQTDKKRTSFLGYSFDARIEIHMYVLGFLRSLRGVVGFSFHRKLSLTRKNPKHFTSQMLNWKLTQDSTWKKPEQS